MWNIQIYHTGIYPANAGYRLRVGKPLHDIQWAIKSYALGFATP